MGEDRYVAEVLAVDEVLKNLDRALLDTGVNCGSFLNAYYAKGPYPEIIAENGKTDQLYARLPASAAVALLVPEEARFRVLQLSRVMSRNITKDTLQKVVEPFVGELKANCNFLVSLGAEASRMLRNPLDLSLSDNLLMEVTDMLIRIVPLGMVSNHLSPDTYLSTILLCNKAVNIRAQICWGMVKDFDSFKNDVIALFLSLIKLIKDMHIDLWEVLKLDVSLIKEGDKFLLTQPFLLKEFNH